MYNMREIFRHKGKHVFYNTGEVEESENDAVVIVGQPHLQKKTAEKKEEALTDEQMGIVLGSMSDNRITDSVKDLVAQAEEEDEASSEGLTAEQSDIVLSSMSDNRITDSVKDLVEHARVEESEDTEAMDDADT